MKFHVKLIMFRPRLGYCSYFLLILLLNLNFYVRSDSPNCNG